MPPEYQMIITITITSSKKETLNRMAEAVANFVNVLRDVVGVKSIGWRREGD